MENFLDFHVEQARYAESERERGIVLAGLDGVDGLARDVESRRQLRLAPIAFSTQDFQAVVHENRTLAELRNTTPSEIQSASCSSPDMGRFSQQRNRDLNTGILRQVTMTRCKVYLTICRDSLTMSIEPYILS